MFVVGERVKYMMPLDHDYSYGEILELGKGAAVIRLLTYPHGAIVSISYKYIDHIKEAKRRNGNGNCKNRK